MPRLYDEILAIARNYMGVAAEDYVRRRIRIVQGGGDPEDVQPDRLERLAAGIDMTAKVYMSEEKARRFRDEILALRTRESGDGRPRTRA
ncbi:MAG TPA: hypothetical protein VIL20_10830 [Sandaracinaceae bacterium]